MSFEENGSLCRRGGSRPPQPQSLPETRVGLIWHHMIGWNMLRDLWNTMLERRLGLQMVKYLEIIGFGGPSGGRPLIEQMLAHGTRRLALMTRDTLDECLCWQPYNLFEGPRRVARQNVHAQMAGRSNQYLAPTYHSPDPESEFDFPIVAPPHGQRAQTLWRVHGLLEKFINGQGVSALDQALDVLTTIKHLHPIPAEDVNWYALQKDIFWNLTKNRRRIFYQACRRRETPGVQGWPNGDDVYLELEECGWADTAR